MIFMKKNNYLIEILINRYLFMNKCIDKEMYDYSNDILVELVKKENR